MKFNFITKGIYELFADEKNIFFDLWKIKEFTATVNEGIGGHL